MSVAAAFCEGRRVTEAPQNTEDTLVKDDELDRGEPGPASLGLPNDHVSLAAGEGAEDPAAPRDEVEQSGDFVCCVPCGPPSPAASASVHPFLGSASLSSPRR